MFSHQTLYLISFLVLGALLGYAVGTARMARKFSKSAEEKSQVAIVKVENLEIKIDDAALSRDQDISDLSDRIDESNEETS